MQCSFHRELPVMIIRAAIIIAAICPSLAAETLYNGIVLPDEWPPQIKELSREPMPVPYLENRPEVVPIDVGRQLFVDDFLIEETTLTRSWHTPQYRPDCPVLRPDQPWEHKPADNRPCAMVFSDGVWYDPAAGLFKMWYMGGYCTSTCFATSKDGIHWSKPSLDVVPGTNVVLDKARDSNTVWLDLKESNPARRYKMFIVTQRRDEKGGVDMALFYSADGIHWGTPVATSWAGGDRSTIFFNPFRNKWVYSTRINPATVGRARLYAECTDLADGLTRMDEIGRNWTCADRLDPRNPNEALKDVKPQLYALDAVAYESLILGLFSIWQGDPGRPDEKRNEVLLGFSRDGFHWSRPDRRPFAAVSETESAWNWGNVQSAGGGCLVVGDHLYFYVSGRGRKRATDAASTGLAILRRDGFASMDAKETSGTLTTRPLRFYGSHLFVNADARGGELRVEVLDRNGEVYPALSRGLCMPITTNGTIQRVRWMEPVDLSALAGKPVRFRFHLTRGKLYSFWISYDESGASNGYVAAGGPGYTESRDTVGQAAYKAADAVATQAATRPAPSGEWTCVALHAAFSPRDTAEDFVFDEKMWISNGWRSKRGTKDSFFTPDLWSSSDGVNWTLITDKTPYDPYSEMVVFEGKVWAIKASVWNSADGVQWHKVLDKTPFGGRGYGEAVVFKDRIWQLGSGADVWSTADGVNWTCAVEKAPFGPRMGSAVAAYDGKLWLMAGNTPGANDPVEKGYKDVTTHNDVWCSEDGARWTRVLEHAPWPPRQWCVAAVYAGRLWLIGGYHNVGANNLEDVWTTADGRDWRQFESDVRFAPRHEVTPYVFDGSLWVVAGNTWPVVNDVWRLTLPDGAPARDAR
ncbi:MAG: hypothetical protein GX616_17235 [Planctomycetes bacterium]|nr:hypothetical protein [Planctomycetota bacterium]